MIKLNDVTVKFKSFPNKETFFDHNELSVCSNINKIDFKYEDDSDLIKLMFLKKYLDETNGFETYLKIYYLPYSRMDRSENGSPFTLKYVSEFINSLNFDSVEVVEAHSNVSLALLNKCKHNLINEKLVKKVINILGLDMDNDYIMFPDVGSNQRYKNIKYKNTIIGNKTRDFETGEIKGLELLGLSEVKSDKVLIVDDLSSYGGTFVHSAIKLREQGFKEVYLLVAHAENSIFKGELFNHVDKVFTTNSLLTEQENWENQKFKEQLHIFDVNRVMLTENKGIINKQG